MKRFLIAVFGIIVVSVLGASAFVWTFNSYEPKDEAIGEGVGNLEYFNETYEACRGSFRALSGELLLRYPEMKKGFFTVESKRDSDLTVDWFYIHARKKTTKLLIMTSGLHGIEGFAGSAIQHMFMQQIFQDSILDETGLFFIHGLNPYGFKYGRKVTEYNVDLNRNCLEEFPAKITNEGFAELKSFLIPAKEVNIHSVNNKMFPLKVIMQSLTKGVSKIRESTLMGQYEFSNGFYYGGGGLEPQIKQLKKLFENILPKYKIVLNIDLHTGYGKRGEMHVFLNPVDDEEVKSSIEYLFSHETIDWGDSKGFYTINGDYLNWSNGLFKDSLCIPILLEFGTFNSQHIIGSAKSLQIMINENQGYHNGYKDSLSKVEVAKEFKELYYPASNHWRTKVMDRACQSLSVMMQKFSTLEKH